MKPLRLVVAVVSLLMSANLFADQVTFQTSATLGCFVTDPSTCTPSSSTPSTFNHLTFTGLAAGPATSSGGNLQLLLGNFSSSGYVYYQNFDSFDFFGTVTFTLPTGIAGDNSPTFEAELNGTVIWNNGNVNVNFNNTPQHFTFSSGNTSGSFDFSVGDVTVPFDDDPHWYGNITNATQTTTQAPEPGSLLLMASGLVGLFGAAKRKLGR